MKTFFGSCIVEDALLLLGDYMSGKGSAPRPYSVPKETFDQSFDRIFGVTCKRCGKSGLQPDSVHTCSPQIKEKADEGKSSN